MPKPIIICHYWQPHQQTQFPTSLLALQWTAFPLVTHYTSTFPSAFQVVSAQLYHLPYVPMFHYHVTLYSSHTSTCIQIQNWNSEKLNQNQIQLCNVLQSEHWEHQHVHSEERHRYIPSHRCWCRPGGDIHRDSTSGAGKWTPAGTPSYPVVSSSWQLGGQQPTQWQQTSTPPAPPWSFVHGWKKVIMSFIFFSSPTVVL